MDISNEAAVWFWELRFGEEIAAQDRKGQKIMKQAYRRDDSIYGWDIYYHIPPSGSGCRLRDFEIVNIKTRAKRS